MNSRNLDTRGRPSFIELTRQLSLPDTKLLKWLEEDRSVHPEAARLGVWRGRARSNRSVFEQIPDKVAMCQVKCVICLDIYEQENPRSKIRLPTGEGLYVQGAAS